MRKLDDKELENIVGGALEEAWIGIVIAGIITFVSGVINGFTNPNVCQVN